MRSYLAPFVGIISILIFFAYLAFAVNHNDPSVLRFMRGGF